jgi:hypothetical protein
MRLPERMNPGILNKMNTSIPEYIFIGRITIGIPLKTTYTRHDRPSEKAIGNLSKRQMTKTDKSRNIIASFL